MLRAPRFAFLNPTYAQLMPTSACPVADNRNLNLDISICRIMK
jgi:hypothetical protein